MLYLDLLKLLRLFSTLIWNATQANIACIFLTSHSFFRHSRIYITYTEKTRIRFPLKLNGIWSWWQFSFRFSEPNGNLFGSKSKGKKIVSPRSYHIQFERKTNTSFLSVQICNALCHKMIKAFYFRSTWRAWVWILANKLVVVRCHYVKNGKEVLYGKP